tara:strand:+ start:4027 stop:4656 length:630 start_codon:yes stop_codon:yes gene_type:complete
MPKKCFLFEEWVFYTPIFYSSFLVLIGKIKMIIKRVICGVFLGLIITQATLVHAGGVFGDIFSGDFDSATGRIELASWNRSNLEHVHLSNERLGCAGDYEATYTYTFGTTIKSGGKDCSVSFDLKNDSDDIIKALVLEVTFLNKSSGKVAITEKITVWAKVIPGGEVQVSRSFDNSDLALAYRQLGEEYSWNYELVGAVPQDGDPKWLY